jgi:hypothetical protein
VLDLLGVQDGQTCFPKKYIMPLEFPAKINIVFHEFCGRRIYVDTGQLMDLQDPLPFRVTNPVKEIIFAPPGAEVHVRPENTELRESMTYIIDCFRASPVRTASVW